MKRLMGIGLGVAWVSVSVAAEPPRIPRVVPQSTVVSAHATEPANAPKALQLTAGAADLPVTPTVAAPVPLPAADCPTCGPTTAASRSKGSVAHRLGEWLFYRPAPAVLPRFVPNPIAPPLQATFPCNTGPVITLPSPFGRTMPTPSVGGSTVVPGGYGPGAMSETTGTEPKAQVRAKPHDSRPLWGKTGTVKKSKVEAEEPQAASLPTLVERVKNEVPPTPPAAAPSAPTSPLARSASPVALSFDGSAVRQTAGEVPAGAKKPADIVQAHVSTPGAPPASGGGPEVLPGVNPTGPAYGTDPRFAGDYPLNWAPNNTQHLPQAALAPSLLWKACQRNASQSPCTGHGDLSGFRFAAVLIKPCPTLNPLVVRPCIGGGCAPAVGCTTCEKDTAPALMPVP